MSGKWEAKCSEHSTLSECYDVL
ncbi:protein of unknown function [Candidatus Methylomirabilis oxygeniifera]|uniref:Uncharacterized protein n=1 Tax=Methylomirabilis oxygeniifera TaxID=671143 RepID=D5MKP9_METO1|nr:protein of unknown function [Candidatus Methylomirabilis oxyfera]